jgi:hypothetical protein
MQCRPLPDPAERIRNSDFSLVPPHFSLFSRLKAGRPAYRITFCACMRLVSVAVNTE